MAIKWGVYRNQIRRSSIADPDATTFSNEQMGDAIGWALDRFVAHTAMPKEWRLDAVSNAELDTPYDLDTATAIALPEDNFQPVDFEGVVSLISEGHEFFADPINRTDGLHPYAVSGQSIVYSIWPENVINLPSPIGASNTLRVRYFAYYPHPAIPTEDEPEAGIDDDILVPRWALQPIVQLVSHYLVNNLAVQSAGIDRWKDKTDSGTPEDNALRVQADFLYKQYMKALADYPNQDRVNYFREFSTGFDAWSS